MNDFSRRKLLSGAASAAAAWSVVSTSARSYGRILGANDRLGIGYIGTGSRAGAHMKIGLELRDEGACELAAVCDVYGPRVRDAAALTGGKIYRNYRELLADPRVDAVCVATPDRHHAQQTIDAVRAGKDVYCEKPLTHWSQFELAKQVGEEAAEYGRIVQVGTQFVADEAYAQVRKLIADGVVGKIMHVHAAYFRRGDWGERMKVPDPQAVPGPELDWEQFLGDAPRVDYSVSRFFQWRMYWDYAGGPATDLLVHTFTPSFCMLDLGYPQRVLGGGGRFEYDREVPDQCNILIDYEGGPSVVLMNSLSNNYGGKHVLRGTDGVIEFETGDRSGTGVRILPFSKNGKQEIHIPWQGAGNTGKLWRNFIDCVHSRKEPYCPVALGVRVQAPLIMGILSHRENKVARFDKTSQQIVLG